MERLRIVLAAIAYVAAMLWSYCYILAPYYAYMHLNFAPASTSALVMAVLVALLPALWLPTRLERPSILVYYTLYMLLYVPSCIVPTCTLFSEARQLIPYQACLISCFFLLGTIYGIPLIKLPTFPVLPATYWGMLLAACLGGDLLIMMQFGTSFHLPSLSEIYDLRAEAYDTLRSANASLMYLILWQSQVITPLLVVGGLRFKNPVWIAIGVLSQLMVFSILGTKTVLFASILLTGVYLVLTYFRQRIIVAMLSGIAAFIVLCALVDAWRDGPIPLLSALFVRRNVLVPGLLSGMYYDFFSNNPKACLGHSILSGIFSYPYTENPPKIIGLSYFNANVSANASFWSDGYANFGLLGMVGTTCLLGGILWLFDSAARKTDERLAILMLVLPAMSLVNSGLLTVMQSHGLGLALVLIYLMPRTEAPVARARSVAPAAAPGRRLAAA